MSQNVVELQNICKGFPGVLALSGVDFSCRMGEVHALVGENGAGKSTLMKILAGAYRQDEGRVRLKGEEISSATPREAQECGISIIYQEFNLLPELNVAENIFLGREPRKRMGFIDRRTLYQRAGELLADLGVEIDLKEKVKNLGVAQQQMVEVAKALSLKADIIVMDEPSAVVSGRELKSLFRIIRRLKEQGRTIIYISHRIDEIFEISDRTTVLKDGQIVDTVRTGEVDKPTLVRMMVGRPLTETSPPRGTERGERVLELKKVSLGRELKEVSLEAHQGEILGLAGLVGSGRTALARVIFGADTLEEGEILFLGDQVSRINPRRSIARGIGLVTESRGADGIVQCLSVRKNLSLPTLDKIRSWIFVKDGQEREACQGFVDQFGIVAASPEQEIQFLSGGNQQKVILAKWINIDPKLLILDEPTRGIDVGAKAEIYDLMRKLAQDGTSIIMISSELPEILGMSDRIVVMHDGRVTGELTPQEATEEKILMLATGQEGDREEAVLGS